MPVAVRLEVARVRAVGLIACGLLVAACSGGTDDRSSPAGDDAPTSREEPAVFPDEDWAVGDPQDLGFDPAALDQVAADAQRYGSDCLVVIRHGEIAGEWYWNGFTSTTTRSAASMTKSWTSTLVGIAQDEGHLHVDDPASSYIDEWAGTPSAGVTVRNLLSNDSGRHSILVDDLADLAPLVDAPDRTAYAIGLEQDHRQGTVWNYNDPAIQALDAVLEESTGQDPVAYAGAKLFEPIGATHTSFETDAAGNPWLGGGLRTSCRDAARLGYLYLRDGNWDGTQVVSSEWIEAATRPSQDLFPAYGYLWWLNTPSDVPLDTEAVELFAEYATAFGDQTQLVPEAPETMFWALGAFGQIIQVDPGSDTVVVRMGAAHPNGFGAYHHLGWLTRAVTHALTQG